jgi:hypothetical protein
MPIPPLDIDNLTSLFPPTERTYLRQQILGWLKGKAKEEIKHLVKKDETDQSTLQRTNPQTAPSIPPTKFYF